MDLLTQLLALPAGDAIFDLDGTLIRGDIGDSVFRRLMGRLPPSVRAVLGHENPWGRYEEIVRADFCAAGDLAGSGLPFGAVHHQGASGKLHFSHGLGVGEHAACEAVVQKRQLAFAAGAPHRQAASFGQQEPSERAGSQQKTGAGAGR